MSGRIQYGAPTSFIPATIAGGQASEGDIFAAAVKQMELVDNTTAASVALERAYSRRTEAIKAATGVDLGNPFTDATSQALDFTQREEAIAAGQTRYQQRLEELAATAAPDLRDVIAADRPVEKDAEASAREADEDLGRLMAASPGWSGNVSSFAGQVAGSLRDPVTIGSLFLGGGGGAAKTVVGRILQTAAREAFVNAATTAVMQPSSQSWREAAGLPHGFDEAASNVLFSAALGGGLGFLAKGAHEAAVPLLRRVAPALAPEARGALQAAETADTLDAQKPAGVPQETHDRQVMKADVAAQGRDVPLSPDVPDEVAVNRIVNALAPSPDSVSGLTGGRTDASIDRLVAEVTQPEKAALGAPTPILDHIRAMGGIDPSSPVAAELKAAGVTARSIYRKGGLKALDNLPRDELPESVRHSIADDGNGYASEDALVQAAGGEASAFGAGRTVDDVAAIREHYERQGVDFGAPIEDVRAQVRAVDDAEERYGAASGSNGMSTDEVVSVPEGFTRRQHTEQLVRAALRQQPGLPADLVHQAVNLSLFENVPIEEAVSDVMSDAAGVPRISAQPQTARAIDVGELGSEPPALQPDRALEEADLDLKAELEAMKELGFAGDFALPIGDAMQSLEALQAQLEEGEWLGHVVEACKA